MIESWLFGHFAFLARITRMKTNSLFLNPQIVEIHRFSERSVVFCNLRRSTHLCGHNPSGRDGLGYPISLRRSRFRLQRFRFAIPRRRIGDQRFKKVMRDISHVIHRAIECFFVCARWLCKSGKLPNKLERRSANLVIRRWW
jgi:hypothetical protein